MLAALLIAPRDFNYTNCVKCEKSLYYTYLGEPCPTCGEIVTDFQHGQFPKASATVTENGNGHEVDAKRLRRRRRRRNDGQRTALQAAGAT